MSERYKDQIAAAFFSERPGTGIEFVIMLLATVAVPFIIFWDSSQPIRIFVGLSLSGLGLLTTLTYLRKYLSKIEKRKDLANNLLDHLPCYAILICKDLRILWTDQLFRTHFGNGKGTKCYELCRSTDSPCEECPVQKTFMDGEIHTLQQSWTTKAEERLDLMIHSAPLKDENGAIVAVLEIAVNITPVKEIQRQLVMMGQTVAGMAHSIKNIMMGLDGGIYVVNRGLEADDQAEVKEGWQMVQLNFDKVARLVEDILYCSKEREPELKEIKPNDVLQEVYELYKDTAKSYDISMTIDLDENLDKAVMDPKGLHKVAANLVTNAIDACKVDLWKDSHEINLSSRKGMDGSTVLEITDNGAGMDEEIKGRAFEEFFSSKGNQGTGLGLMVTQKVVHEHGGTIRFRSSPGKGTTFTVVFPPGQLKGAE
jgi:signal transduction histidine kinase